MAIAKSLFPYDSLADYPILLKDLGHKHTLLTKIVREFKEMSRLTIEDLD